MRNDFCGKYPGHRDEVIAVLNGAVGDRLHERDSSLAISMRLFHGSEPWLLDDPPVTIPNARPRACLFVHGLMGSERAWRFGVSEPSATVDPGRVDYAAALADARDCTPIYVRYNSGRHISENGRALAEQLEQLRLAWPTPVGTRAFASCRSSRTAWADSSRAAPATTASRRVTGGSRSCSACSCSACPRAGLRSEQVAHVTAFTLEKIWNPWTKIIGRVINLRSAGIKDLRHGFVLDEDWRHLDLDRLALPVPGKPRDPLHVRWYVAAGTLGPPGSPARAHDWRWPGARRQCAGVEPRSPRTRAAAAGRGAGVRVDLAHRS